MTKRTTFLLLLCLSVGVIVMAHLHSPLTPAEKVAEAELIVHGIASLEGLPVAKTEHPVERSCRIVVLQTLWPTNQPATNTIVVRTWAWTQWPVKWWNYNSQTGCISSCSRRPH